MTAKRSVPFRPAARHLAAFLCQPVRGHLDRDALSVLPTFLTRICIGRHPRPRRGDCAGRAEHHPGRLRHPFGPAGAAQADRARRLCRRRARQAADRPRRRLAGRARRPAARLGAGTRSAPRDALVAASADEANRGKAFGLEGAGDNAGAFLGPLIALALLGFWAIPLRWIFYLAIVPGLVAFLLVLPVRERPVSFAAKARIDVGVDLTGSTAGICRDRLVRPRQFEQRLPDLRRACSRRPS